MTYSKGPGKPGRGSRATAAAHSWHWGSPRCSLTAAPYLPELGPEASSLQGAAPELSRAAAAAQPAALTRAGEEASFTQANMAEGCGLALCPRGLLAGIRLPAERASAVRAGVPRGRWGQMGRPSPAPPHLPAAAAEVERTEWGGVRRRGGGEERPDVGGRGGKTPQPKVTL